MAYPIFILIFLAVVVWAFRPGSSKVYKDTANIPFRHEDKPAPEMGKAKEARS